MTVKAISGVIQKIFVKELPAPDRFENKFRRSIQVNDTWFSFGGMKSGDWNIKHGAGFAILGEGSEVMFKAESTTGKDGKEYWNGKGLTVLNLVEGQRGGQQPSNQNNSSQQNTYQAKPRDNTGVSVGHSFNGAMNFITTWGVEPTNENIVKYAKLVHNVTEKVKAEYAKANPDMSAYDAGAASGNSVLNACKVVGTEIDFEKGIYDLSMNFLNDVVPKILAHVKNPASNAPPPKVTRQASTPKPATKAPAVQVEEDEDDTIPF